MAETHHAVKFKQLTEFIYILLNEGGGHPPPRPFSDKSSKSELLISNQYLKSVAPSEIESPLYIAL